LKKTSLASRRAKKVMERVVSQLKLEKEKRDLVTQNEEFKNIIIKIGVNPEDRSVVQKLLQGAETKV